jgi:hypothetical protein
MMDSASGQTCEQARPETHQNLIHPDKDRHLHRRRQRHRNSFLTYAGAEPSMPITFASPRYNPTISPPDPQIQDRGGGDRTRTDDPLLAKQVLSQLSYTPKSSARQIQGLANEEHWWAREDLNLRPHAYQACALTS